MLYHSRHVQLKEIPNRLSNEWRLVLRENNIVKISVFFHKEIIYANYKHESEDTCLCFKTKHQNISSENDETKCSNS